MTDSRKITSAFPEHRRPFLHDPGRWEVERSRALRTSGHVRDHSPDYRPALVHESSRWGWLAWPVPADGSLPDLPLYVGILTPTATRCQRLALRWLTRHPAHRIAVAPCIPGSLRACTAITALACLAACLFALRHGLPWEVVWPAMLLAPLLTECLPAPLDARARQHVRTVDGEASVRYLHRLTSMQSFLDQAADGSDCYELRRSAQVGQHMLWDAANLLQEHDTRVVSGALILRERLMVQLVDQVAAIRACLSGPPATEHDRGRAKSPLGPYLLGSGHERRRPSTGSST
ncbi:hypothetical protein ACICHK_00225 [Streptomyces sp. AHU1]|uniref:hypothetical protein n=1 Tax=Streptomyces sp. AHU1 TaxID=3377215 RepID=UPI0038782350